MNWSWRLLAKANGMKLAHGFVDLFAIRGARWFQDHFAYSRGVLVRHFLGLEFSTLAVDDLRGERQCTRRGYRDSGFTTVAVPASVKRSFSCARRALARSIDSSVVSTQPAPMSSPVRTLPDTISSSSCSMLACSCLHQATKRPGADVVWAPSIWLNRASLAFSSSAAFWPRFGVERPVDETLSSGGLRVIITGPHLAVSHRLGDVELAPPVWTDRALYSLAGRRWLELNASRALLPVLRLILVFRGLMREFRLGK